MSHLIPSRPPGLDDPLVFAIVASRYNREFVDGLVNGARNELAVLAPKSRVELHEVPGSFEIPLGVQAVAERGNAHAILAFGLLWEGETLHASLIATAVTGALMDISLKHKLPVLHEVLVIQNEEQARARCLDTEINRGVEAARASVAMLAALKKINSSNP
jgi:6,7-dimethyl-8-ribityllumazine synthase